jgi:uncharacterized protein YaaQ
MLKLSQSKEVLMTDITIRHLVTAIVQDQDSDLATRALTQIGVPVIHLASTGGFLGRRNATLLIGLPEHAEEKVLEALKASCRQRVEYLAIPLEGSPLPMPSPVPVTVGGVTVFTLPVERFEEF